jgi:hypothetical protein
METISFKNRFPLAALLDVLTNIYNSGADYIDIVGTPDEVQDNVGIIVKEEYMSKDNDNREEYDFDVETFKVRNNKLTDEDLNQLM